MSTCCQTEWEPEPVPEDSPRVQSDLCCPVIEGTDGSVALRGAYAHKKFHRHEAFEREVCTLHQLSSHPNIIEPLAVLENKNILVFRRYFNDLLRILISEDWAQHLDKEACLFGVLDGLMYIQSVCLVHRDIKPENILLDGLHHRNRPVLCDFARATFAPLPLVAAFSGTWAYAAPEALRGRCALPGDVWSMGTVLFCLFERLSPFDEEDESPIAKEDWGGGAGVLVPAVPFTDSAWAGPLRAATQSLVRGMLAVSEEARSDATVIQVFLSAHRSTC